MNGSDATREIRRYEQDAGLPATPVVALTAHDLAEISKDAGYTTYLSKPILRATLFETLANYAKPPAAGHV